MGAFAWSFLLRKVLSGLPGLAPPCCAVRARGVGLASLLAVPASRGFGVVVEVLQQGSGSVAAGHLLPPALTRRWQSRSPCTLLAGGSTSTGSLPSPAGS